MMRAAAILAAAADLVEEAWAQGEAVVTRAANCAGIALNRASMGACDVEPRIEAYRALIREIGTDNIVTWNDAPGRCQAEVVTALRNAKRWL